MWVRFPPSQPNLHTEADSENYIKSLIIILSLALIAMTFPGKVVAETNPEVAYENIKIPTIEELQIAAIDALSKKLTAKAESLVGKKQGQCVVAVREFLGVGRSEVSGLAKDTKVNSYVPEVGSIIIFWGTARYPAGHVGTVLFTTADGEVYYYSPNSTGSKAVAGGPAKISHTKIKSRAIKGYRKVPSPLFI